MNLRRLEPKDLEDTFRWRNYFSLWKWCRQNGPLHRSKHLEWFEWQAKEPSVSMFAICDGEDLMGVCGLTSIDHINARAEFSCYIAPHHQKKGNAEKALHVLFTYGFDYLNLNSIWGETFDDNPAAKLFTKLGMKLEGTRRGFYFRDGKYIDAHLYSLLRSEYLELPWKSALWF
jgi:[ribosomal protein S5]-alanine N-acetyltransferase